MNFPPTWFPGVNLHTQTVHQICIELTYITTVQFMKQSYVMEAEQGPDAAPFSAFIEPTTLGANGSVVTMGVEYFIFRQQSHAVL